VKRGTKFSQLPEQIRQCLKANIRNEKPGTVFVETIEEIILKCEKEISKFVVEERGL